MVEMKLFPIQGSFLVEEAPPTAWSTGVPLYDVASGMALLATCERSEIAVLGVEGFRLDGKSRTPDMDFIADFSVFSKNPDFIAASVQAAYQFLEMAEEDSSLVFEFLLMAKMGGS